MEILKIYVKLVHFFKYLSHSKLNFIYDCRLQSKYNIEKSYAFDYMIYNEELNNIFFIIIIIIDDYYK